MAEFPGPGKRTGAELPLPPWGGSAIAAEMTRSLALILGLTAGTAAAQPPVADPAPVKVPSPTAILTDPPPTGQPVVIVEETTQPRRLAGSFDFLVGAFTGVRYRTAPVFFNGKWSGEVFGGFAAVVLPGAGVGLRRHAYAAGDGTDALCVAPGVGAYVLFEPWGWGHDRDGGAVGGAGVIDVDFTWNHTFSSRFVTSLGVKAGAAVVFGRKGVVPFPVPVFGMFFGCGF